MDSQASQTTKQVKKLEQRMDQELKNLKEQCDGLESSLAQETETRASEQERVDRELE